MVYEAVSLVDLEEAEVIVPLEKWKIAYETFARFVIIPFSDLSCSRLECLRIIINFGGI